MSSCSNSALIGSQGFRLSIRVPGLARNRSSTHWACAERRDKEGASGKMAAAAAGVGRLEEEALRRKERLKALREKTGRKVRGVERELQARRPVFWLGGRAED